MPFFCFDNSQRRGKYRNTEKKKPRINKRCKQMCFISTDCVCNVWCINETAHLYDLWPFACVPACMIYASHITRDTCMYCCSSCTCIWIYLCACDTSFYPQKPVSVRCVAAFAGSSPRLWRRIQVVSVWSFYLWLNLSHLVNSHHASLFSLANNCENKLEQSVTANQNRESQEAERRARVKLRARGCVCVSSWKFFVFLPQPWKHMMYANMWAGGRWGAAQWQMVWLEILKDVSPFIQKASSVLTISESRPVWSGFMHH